MAIHRWRIVVDLYAHEENDPETIAAWLRTILTTRFPLGVVEGYPDVYDQDAMRAKIETPA